MPVLLAKTPKGVLAVEVDDFDEALRIASSWQEVMLPDYVAATTWWVDPDHDVRDAR